MSFTINICLFTVGIAYILTGTIVKSAPQMSMGNYSLPDMSMGGIDMGGMGIGGNGGNGIGGIGGNGNGGSVQPWGEFQNQTSGMMPGMEIGSGYVDQWQNVTLPPFGAGDLTNATIPSGQGYWNRFQEQTGNINNQTSQFQGCMPVGNNNNNNNNGQ